MTKISKLPISLCKKEVLRYLGYKPHKSNLSPRVLELTDEMMDKAQLIIQPRGIFKTLEITNIQNNIILFSDDEIRLKGAGMADFLSQCSKASFLAVTIGSKIDMAVTELFDQGDSAKAVTLDAVGSDAVEQGVNWITRYIQNLAKSENYRTLGRRSPGYGIWPIFINKDIANLLRVEEIGMKVLDSCQLIPRKSVMALIGWVSLK